MIEQRNHKSTLVGSEGRLQCAEFEYRSLNWLQLWFCCPNVCAVLAAACRDVRREAMESPEGWRLCGIYSSRSIFSLERFRVDSIWGSLSDFCIKVQLIGSK